MTENQVSGFMVLNRATLLMLLMCTCLLAELITTQSYTFPISILFVATFMSRIEAEMRFRNVTVETILNLIPMYRMVTEMVPEDGETWS